MISRLILFHFLKSFTAFSEDEQYAAASQPVQNHHIARIHSFSEKTKRTESTSLSTKYYLLVIKSLVRNRIKSRWPLRKHTQNRVLHRQTDKAGLQRKQVLPVAVQRTRHRAVRVLQAKGPADSAPLAVQCRGFRQKGGRGVRAEGGARRRTAD